VVSKLQFEVRPLARNLALVLNTAGQYTTISTELLIGPEGPESILILHEKSDRAEADL
jgi:hypothetical protein